MNKTDIKLIITNSFLGKKKIKAKLLKRQHCVASLPQIKQRMHKDNKRRCLRLNTECITTGNY